MVYFIKQNSFRIFVCYKSADSSPKTPSVLAVGEDSVFISPTTTNSSKMTNATNQSENSSTSGNQNEASSAGNKPDWKSSSLEDKLNFLIDMSYNNSQCIQTISKNLDNHSQEIKSLVAYLELNNTKIKTLSENFVMVNKSLADIKNKLSLLDSCLSYLQL
ncbi:hypothetical protein KQX54_003069 [Cotesia glomerata]|uniref:Biogenesis of lysosome-related organelles complex 1 subunit 3 n=1 Tax=Cotesia glomerata TaxID=32391 RepID=A0AAV7IQE3_COTGL|nr:hypothetical protein KQX54_003069 [Cotesia glomerata]